jgi:protein-tyrosine phosphatase
VPDAETSTDSRERRIELEGAHNFRDLGGYVGADGATVRWGRVYRSDHLGELTDGDLDRLVELRVSVVVDFRSTREHTEMPSRIVPGGSIELLSRPILDGTAPGATFYDLVTNGELKDFTPEDLARFYRRTLRDSAAVYGEVLTMIATMGDDVALVFHCAAGKDRTGLAAALLLGALGVDDEQILDDYEATNRYRSGRRLEEIRPALAEKGIDVDRLMPLFIAPRPAMAGALASLRDDHGGIESYLRTSAGLDAATLARLRETLLA